MYHWRNPLDSVVREKNKKNDEELMYWTMCLCVVTCVGLLILILIQ